MSITVNDIMRLPSLQKATVTAGHKGLQKVVNSISVLEYSDPSDLQEQFFSLKDFRKGELVLSAFINIKDSVEKQCTVLRRLYEAGEVGLILYYVGIFVPSIDPQLIALADQLEFPLICMPENDMGCQYGHVIYEVMEEIVKEHRMDTYLVGEILEKVAFLPSYRRSMDYVLRLLSNRVAASLYLVDEQFRLINGAAFQKEGLVQYHQISQYYNGDVGRISRELEKIQTDTRQTISCQKIRSGNQSNVYLLLVKENGELSRNICWQAAEVVQVYLRVWSQGHAELEKDEILKSILLDEQEKMRRLAESMQFAVAEIRHMTLIFPKRCKKELSHVSWKKVQNKVKQILDKHYALSICGMFDQSLILLTGEENIRGTFPEILGSLMEEIQGEKDEWQFVLCRGLDNIRDIRKTFVECKNYLQEAMQIFPLKNPLTSQEVQFSGMCRQIMYRGEESVRMELLPLKDLDEQEDGDLYKTLETYFLDADMSIVKTAELMYLHKNTIKYRITKMTETFHYRVNKMPEAYGLYKAVALYRLMTKLNAK